MSERKGERLNLYVCPKRHKTMTIDVAIGVTPFMLMCKHEGCEEFAQSSLYAPECGVLSLVLPPRWEWYRPSGDEYINLDVNDRESHVDKGGLLLRKRTEAEPVCNSDPRKSFDHPYWKEELWKQELAGIPVNTTGDSAK